MTRQIFFSLCIVRLACSSCALKVTGTDYTMLPMSPLVPPSLKRVMPIEFVHVPKCGTSFLNTLMHIPGVCPGLSQDLEFNSEGGILMGQWQKQNPDSNCDLKAWDAHRISHTGVGSFYALGKGRFMGFFRQPEDRLISHFNFKIEERMSALKHGREPRDDVPLDMFIANFSGCETKTLTRNGGMPCDYQQGGDGNPPSPHEVQEAKTRLREGFSFVGITDQWSLSICLFNVMFNQDCHSYQFENSRPTAGKSTPTYNVSVLNGYRDPYDNELYDLALELFDENLKKFNVSESSCQQCWDAAGI
mmetsp:Transcript_83228/g.184939  ORF Transcript_83228/g.184939 Transcript_83228/m.184939 type:complete len:304 (+) Transcript_83228:64-975(+)